MLKDQAKQQRQNQLEKEPHLKDLQMQNLTFCRRKYQVHDSHSGPKSDYSLFITLMVGFAIVHFTLIAIFHLTVRRLVRKH